MSNIVYPTSKKSQNQELPDKIAIGSAVMTRAKPSARPDALDVEGLRPSGFCQVHGRKLVTAPDGTRYCPGCAARAYRREQQAKVEEDSAKMVRGR